MAHVFDEYVKAEISAPSGSAAFDFTSETVPTGFQGFDASKLATNDTTTYAAVDASGNREVGIGTWNETSKTLTRTVVLSSTNSDSAETFTGTVTVTITATAAQAESNYHAAAGGCSWGSSNFNVRHTNNDRRRSRRHHHLLHPTRSQ